MRFDGHAASLPVDVREAVRAASKASHEGAAAALRRDLPDPDALRRLAGGIRRHAIEHLDALLEQAEGRLVGNGARVHWASDGESARRTVLSILRDRGVRTACKSKSMVSEEIGLTVPFGEGGSPHL